jgi:formylglycine-generating enzyme required for sulfatase activity
MDTIDLINYFGEDVYKELCEFYKFGSLAILMKHQVSSHNIRILLDYLKAVRRKGVKPATIENNCVFMRFLLTHFNKDIDKMDWRDRDDILDMIDDWKTLKGKPAKDNSKKQYKISFHRFLDKYGKKTNNKELRELADFEIHNGSSERRLPKDLLTEEDVVKLIKNANGIRNKALIAVLYESGARRGELENCKLKDVSKHKRGNENFYRLILNGKTGERQVIIFRYQQWLRQWIAVCQNNNPDSPLFPTLRKYNKNGECNYRPISGQQINLILQETATKAGITKNVHAHLFRHSQATKLANIMTEQQLKTQFGWTRGSNMTEVYIHLSGKDTELAILKSFGKYVDKDEKGNEVEYCVQCGEVISPGYNSPSTYMEFVLIPAGKFMMGSPSYEKGRYNSEGPVHEVMIKDSFYMSKCSVTQKHWEKIMGNNPSKFKGEDLPVESVSWDDVQKFIKKLNEKENTIKYRLPSESEWEYTCRAGTANRYYFGDDESKLENYAWYNSVHYKTYQEWEKNISEGKTHPVGLKRPNSWGLYDMHGNVDEWCQDKFHYDYNGAPFDGSAWESGNKTTRVVKGGSWNKGSIHCRSANRGACDPGYRGSDLGFRIIREI